MLDYTKKYPKKCVVLKGMFQSPQLKYHVQTIGIDQYLSNNDIYEHKCLENIKILYQQDGKCDDQQQFKDIFDYFMVSTPEVFTDNSRKYPMTSTPIKFPRAWKSLCMFTNILDVKKKNATRQVGAAKSKRKTIKYRTKPWSLS